MSTFKALVQSLSSMALILFVAMPALADTYTFQHGANGYERAQDTSIRWTYTANFGDTLEVDMDHMGDPGAYETWSTGSGRTSVLEVGNFYQRDLGSVGSGVSNLESGPTYRYSRMYIRFRDVFGTGAGQVPPSIGVARATLKLYNTEDQGAVVAVGGAAYPDPTTGPNNTLIANPQAQPKLNAGTIAVYPSLIPITFGFDDGTAKKGRVTARDRRRGKQGWAQGACNMTHVVNDPAAMAIHCGPADFDNPLISPGENEIDSSHPGAITVAQNADEGFKDFDVTGLLDFITGDSVYITIDPVTSIPTMDLNHGNAYRSSDFGDIYDSDGNFVAGASAADIATRPMLIIELVPEPATVGLFGFGGLLLLQRRKNKLLD